MRLGSGGLAATCRLGSHHRLPTLILDPTLASFSPPLICLTLTDVLSFPRPSFVVTESTPWTGGHRHGRHLSGASLRSMGRGESLSSLSSDGIMYVRERAAAVAGGAVGRHVDCSALVATRMRLVAKSRLAVVCLLGRGRGCFFARAARGCYDSSAGTHPPLLRRSRLPTFLRILRHGMLNMSDVSGRLSPELSRSMTLEEMVRAR